MAPPLPPLPMPAMMAGNLPHEVDTIRRAVDKGKTNSSMALMGTSRPDHCSFQDSSYYIDSESGRELLLLRQHDDVPDDFSARVQTIRGIGLSTHEEFSGQDPQNQQSDADLNNIPCLPLDKKRTIKAMQIISVSALTMIGALSTYSADTLALALFPWSLTKEVFVTSPYVCITVGSIGVVLSFCASENDALAEYAAIAILLVCLSGIVLGALAVIVILHAAHHGTVLWILIWTYVIMITLIGGWGWLFAYPTCLKFNMRMMYWICFDRRKSTSPWSEAYADPRSTQHTDQKGFGRMLSTFVAACGRAFHPLDEDATIEVMKTFSPTILTPMSVLSLWVAHTIAPRAHMARTLQQFLYASPYVYLPLGVVTIALSVSASRSNGLANCASWLGLSLCTFGVILGAWCSIFLLHTRPLLTGIVSDVVIIAMFGAWGWMLAYPKRLRFVMRLIVFACCAPRGCVCSFWAWIFLWLKVFGLSVVQFVPRCFGFFRAPRGWWTAGRASSARGELDIEAGTNAVELTCLAGSCSPEEG